MKKIVIAALSIIAVFAFLLIAYNLTNTPSAPAFPEVSKIKSSDQIKWATDSANVLVEYSDLQCPACQSFQQFIQKEIESSGSANRDVTNKITFVYRHFPLVQHQHAQNAAYAAEAAGKQGKFFEFIDIAFIKQKDWAESSKAIEIFESYAKELGLDLEKFRIDRDSQEVKNKVQADLLSGEQAGVNSTPTFYLNGKKLGPINSFDQLLEPLKNL
ncbi:hypothetical protein A2774_00965 [Candidatus Roizmanbacteria bacterium RIFCSPHIGHO2_01_FULL_39_12c]|uniref:Thioredoxin-like fold domain-containing protein n=1 Tax=Candidatus Roizmanbacteria bacterium RIFCSPHIGHO2_01_FULL_39_12c TaxID=1802031 RepID=A0A1F7GF58_9BACT|nr:MAG: hypothetical protein A2774_00965 [Candidatus Roizmanbacteria bacterium RIFCSPHIGHO2_01_FULL_39_12c]OGK46557.1 MAG: hypothetical protein A2963_02380 [Candidatus Roizmanbacteria bacterium RIFCSPLOWO2_01_FULL_40_13]